MSDINNMLRQTAQIARLVTDPEAPARIERHQQAVTRALQEAREGQRQETEEQPTEAGATVSSETQAIERARQVWPEAEGFLRHTRGWTFRVGGGYASVTNGGVVAKEPQGTRFDAVSYMGRRTSPVHLDGPGCTPVRAYVERE